MTRTYWLSFVDERQPEGKRFRGVAIVDVTEEEKTAAKATIEDHFGPRSDDAYWIGAASRKAWTLGCNPNGQMAALRIDEHPLVAERPDMFPRGVLLDRPELRRLGHEEDDTVTGGGQ